MRPTLLLAPCAAKPMRQTTSFGETPSCLGCRLLTWSSAEVAAQRPTSKGLLPLLSPSRSPWWAEDAARPFLDRCRQQPILKKSREQWDVRALRPNLPPLHKHPHKVELPPSTDPCRWRSAESCATQKEFRLRPFLLPLLLRRPQRLFRRLQSLRLCHHRG